MFKQQTIREKKENKEEKKPKKGGFSLK